MPVTVQDNIVSGPVEENIPAHLSYAQFLYDKFKQGGDKVALINADNGIGVTYKDILQRSINLATSLRKLGLQKGDVVALSSENRFEFTIASHAIIYCGAILSTLDVTYSPGELSHILQIVKPKFIFTSTIPAENIYDCSKGLPFVKHLILIGDYEDYVDFKVPSIFYNDLIKENVDINNFTLVEVNGAEDAVAVMCSSGTTGLPKGVMLTHVNFLTISAHMKFYLTVSQERGKHKIEHALSAIPWFHAYGFLTTMTILCLHVEVIFPVYFDEEQFLGTVEHYQVNMMTIVPPLAVFLAKHPLVTKYNLKSLNEIWCGSAPLSSEIQKLVSQRTGTDCIKQGYGLTEMTMVCCVDLMGGEKVGSCGTPAPGMKMKVVDIKSGKLLSAGEKGELWVKSPLRMKGYMGDPESTNALIDSEGYIRTGDMGYYDKDGYFYIIGRLIELIKYKGFLVAPSEIEALLLQHPSIVDCGVVGMPDDDAGELPTAFVVLQPNAEITKDDIIKYVASKLPPEKHLLGGVIFLEKIPKSTAGKILRRELKTIITVVNISCKLKKKDMISGNNNKKYIKPGISYFKKCNI